MDLVHLNPLVKKAVTLVTGVIISVTEANIELAVTCKLPWFKVGQQCSRACLQLWLAQTGSEALCIPAASAEARLRLLTTRPRTCGKNNVRSAAL